MCSVAGVVSSVACSCVPQCMCPDVLLALAWQSTLLPSLMLAGQPNRVHAPHARDTHLRGGHDQNGALGVGECVCVTCSAAAAAAAGWLVQQEPATHPAAIWPVWHAVPQRLRCCQGCTVYAHSLRTTQEGAKHPLDGFLALPAACCRNVCVCKSRRNTGRTLDAAS